MPGSVEANMAAAALGGFFHIVAAIDNSGRLGEPTLAESRTTFLACLRRWSGA